MFKVPNKNLVEGFNSFLCFKTLVRKEVKRFFSVSMQTLLAPLVNASLYLLVFGVSLGSSISLYENISYLQFVIPGLVLMGIVNNAFANVSSSLFISRYMGNIADLLVTPLTPLQFIMGYSIAAMIRGLLVGLLIMAVGAMFTSFPWPDPAMTALIAVLSSFLFAQFGFLAAIWSKSFDSASDLSRRFILSSRPFAKSMGRNRAHQPACLFDFFVPLFGAWRRWLGVRPIACSDLHFLHRILCGELAYRKDRI